MEANLSLFRNYSIWFLIQLLKSCLLFKVQFCLRWKVFMSGRMWMSILKNGKALSSEASLFSVWKRELTKIVKKGISSIQKTNWIDCWRSIMNAIPNKKKLNTLTNWRKCLQKLKSLPLSHYHKESQNIQKTMWLILKSNLMKRLIDQFQI